MLNSKLIFLRNDCTFIPAKKEGLSVLLQFVDAGSFEALTVH